MSGGAYDYSYYHVLNIARDIETKNNTRRKAFKKLLSLVADALHDIEWVDSGDFGVGDEHKAIDSCFSYCKETKYLEDTKL